MNLLKKINNIQWVVIVAVLLALAFYIFNPMKNTTQDIQTDSASAKNPIAVITTNFGNIEIELYQKDSPKTVENFISYVNDGFYSDTIFHRVINGFMVQGGGFTQDGQQKPTRDPIALESNNGLKNNLGTVAMARTNIPDSATSQFFINVADNDFLNYSPQNSGYAVFGKVVNGMDVVDKIKGVKTGVRNGTQDWPDEDVIIEKVTIK